MRWDPEQYGRFADERARPFHDLTARIGATHPRRVVDLGCGPGTLTAGLALRWPDAVVEGLDSSPEMIESARSLDTRASFRVDDVTGWLPPPDADVVVSNAVLQWVPGHTELLRRWAAALRDGGWLAFQVPGNFSAPAHTVMRAQAERWGIEAVLRPDSVGSPASYAELLLGCGLAVDAWETTYLHVLHGTDPVLEWLRGTGLRPVLATLAPADASRFCDELAPALREAYPHHDGVTLLGYRRIFVVAQRAR